jgi:hypothetical protein
MDGSFKSLIQSTHRQEFRVSLHGKAYGFTLVWSAPANAWLLSVANEDGVLLINSLPLVAADAS